MDDVACEFTFAVAMLSGNRRENSVLNQRKKGNELYN